MTLAGARIRMGPALAALLLLAPFAHAGTESDPEVEDPADVPSDRAADILSAWLTTEAGGVRFHVKVVDGARRLDHVYGIQFTFRDARLDALLGHDGSNRMHGYLGPDSGPAWARGGFDDVANGEVTALRSEGGAPATFSGLIPWSAMAGFEEGGTLEDWVAFTTKYDRTRELWPGGIDGARATPPDYVAVRPAEVETSDGPDVLAAWGWAIVLATTALGAASGLVLARRRKR